ncbi:hypothetical protein [Wenzhouxiangella sp. EGI_FJ10409]|uniref:hypothetical protein n=1 Tax=Wenzhouxiangella sp. EGI_FJ10409 TaxID=3243767 RepID=UPI0035D60B79
MSELTQLLQQLGEDSKLHDEYIADPKKVMKERGLEDEEIQAMLDKDVDKLRKLSGLDALKSNGSVRACD